MFIRREVLSQRFGIGDRVLQTYAQLNDRQQEAVIRVMGNADYEKLWYVMARKEEGRWVLPCGDAGMVELDKEMRGRPRVAAADVELYPLIPLYPRGRSEWRVGTRLIAGYVDLFRGREGNYFLMARDETAGAKLEIRQGRSENYKAADLLWNERKYLIIQSHNGDREAGRQLSSTVGMIETVPAASSIMTRMSLGITVREILDQLTAPKLS